MNKRVIIRFADPATKKQLTEYINRINTRNENARLEKVYSQAKVAFQRADAESEYLDVARKFESISAYKDAAQAIAQDFAQCGGPKAAADFIEARI